ncbi:hypothetical protein LIER_28881 [Lithospermum erythrorhizon]|uniref:Uncharacterized protein n=1 Tax=Lithospermum erythrorhizon TaxID=34254 RepID=A0AAV3RKX7_LITER
MVNSNCPPVRNSKSQAIIPNGRFTNASTFNCCQTLFKALLQGDKKINPTFLCIEISTLNADSDSKWVITTKNYCFMKRILGSSMVSLSNNKSDQINQQVHPFRNLDGIGDSDPKFFVEALLTGLLMISCENYDSIIIVTDGFFTQAGNIFGAQFNDLGIPSSALMAEAPALREGDWQQCTHLVAHWDCGSERKATWLETPPHWLYATLLQDCNS